jgi:hypothetical protein
MKINKIFEKLFTLFLAFIVTLGLDALISYIRFGSYLDFEIYYDLILTFLI